jgi:ribosomal-protein-alanine N-acetyltransferase
MYVSRELEPKSPLSDEPGVVILETERLILRRFHPSEAAAVSAAGNFPEIAANLSDRFPNPYDLKAAEDFLARWTGEPVKQNNAGHLAICVKPRVPGINESSDEPLLVGGVGSHAGADVFYRTWEMGYWLTPGTWGKGYGTEAIGAFVRWCFETWPELNRVESKVYSKNPASAGLLKKCGFIEEGRRRESAVKCGELVDDITYGILRSDLQKAK